MLLLHRNVHRHPTIPGRAQHRLDIRADRRRVRLHRVGGNDARSQGARETPQVENEALVLLRGAELRVVGWVCFDVFIGQVRRRFPSVSWLLFLFIGDFLRRGFIKININAIMAFFFKFLHIQHLFLLIQLCIVVDCYCLGDFLQAWEI